MTSICTSQLQYCRHTDNFRAKLLSRGGSEDGMSLYRAFRGADPDKRAMLRSRGLWDEPEPEPEPDDEGEAPLQPEVRQE